MVQIRRKDDIFAVSCTLVCLLLVSGTDLCAQPAYKVLRYEENYRYLKDPSRRTNFWDAIKYIPLGAREDWYLSLGGELRERYEFFHHEDFGSAPGDRHGNNDYVLQRYLLHGGLHLGSPLRFFVQFMSGLEDGRIGGPRLDIDQDIFDIHQAFLDVVLPLSEKTSLTWRLGRQELSYGSGRLVDVREAPNLRRAFDDDPDPERSLWGVYAVHALPLLPDGHADLYYLGFKNGQALFDQGMADELRHSLGLRLWGRPVLWEYDVEFVWQFGTFGSGTILAWAVASATRYSFSALPLRPRLGLVADITSSDQDPNSVNLQTFNPLFPTGAYFNLADPVGPPNIIHLHPVLDLHFGEKVTATAKWAFFWRESLEDGVYRLSVVPLRTGQQSRQRYIGSSPSLTVVWTPTRHTTMHASYVHFFAGPFLQETPPGKDIDYFTIWFAYKF